jgi:hypothetical protein
MSINATTDRFWAVEVDFDATLDNEFSMTTAKQQVTLRLRVPSNGPLTGRSVASLD